ncbi:MAG: putative 2-aminoethylphosphonate ABC transporter ATP-binding protein [Hydrogenophaga sp.]|nr:putative 2-aminoethylphosphonate ABC transporter ATP-binding protein [Hydrogenophaga sp.]MDP2415968.1 putative 2-aminoethylphosphonate ABC transporter ATP-binding protein [Hydrogenophaga sp.]MDZ4186541.1 putative 2-aminoethylphosphonate ABC transporter ATP-binding protein [Hydrogenophaga sp.]
MKTPYLDVRGVGKRFGAFWALKDVSLRIEAGEFVCFLGPSGCGKTTLLRIIAGLEQQDGGQILQKGRDISGLPSSQRDFGIVFQSYALFPNLNVNDNVGYGLQGKGLGRSAVAERVKGLLDLVGLSQSGAQYPAQLSGGMQQRVALARALATSPSLLLLDEPLSALDARVRAHLRTELRQLHQRLGVTTIMVTHDQEEALSLADRIVVMNHGVIEQVGTPQTIYQQPCSAFVADFVGKTNPLSARLSGPGRANWHGLELACEHLPHLPDHTEVTLTVRPEDIVLHPHSEHGDNPESHGTLQAPLHASNRLGVTVHNLEFLGPFCRVSMHLAQNGQILVADVPTAQALHMGLAAQRRLTIDLPARHIRVYGAHAQAN